MANDETIRLRTELEQAQTIAGLKQLQSETRKFFETTLIGTRENITAGKLYADVGNKLAQVRRVAMTDNAKMMHSYFSLGQEIRQNRFAVLQLGQAMGFDRTGLGGILMSFTQGGLFTALLAGGAAWIKSLHDQAVAATDAALKVDKYAERMKYFRSIKGGLGAAEQKLQDAKFALMTPDQQVSWLRGEIGKDEKILAEQFASTNLTIEGRTTRATIEGRILQHRRDLRDVEKGITEEAYKQYEIFKKWEETRGQLPQYFREGSLFAPGGVVGGFGRGVFGRYAPTSGEAVSAARANIAATPQATTEEVFIKRADRELTTFQYHSVRVAETMKFALSSAFVESFGIANNLLNTFLESLLSELLDFAINMGMNTMTSGGYGAAKGLGMPIKITETPHGVVRQYGNRGGQMTLRVIPGRVGLTDLSLAVERGNRLRQGGNLSG